MLLKAGLPLCLDHITLVSAVKAEQTQEERAAAIVLSRDSQRAGTDPEGANDLTTSTAFTTVGNAGERLIQGRLNQVTAPIS